LENVHFLKALILHRKIKNWSSILIKKFKIEDQFNLVEATRVELVSENSSAKASPSADRLQDSPDDKPPDGLPLRYLINSWRSSKLWNAHVHC